VDGRIVDAGALNASELAIGDCFDDGVSAATEEATDIGDVTARPCDEPHDSEVFHTFDLQSDELPTDDEIMDEAYATFDGAFETFVGTTFEGSELDYGVIWPNHRGWKAGDRTVTCALFSLDGSKLEGSVRGSGR
jgi:hypothetical protein